MTTSEQVEAVIISNVFDDAALKANFTDQVILGKQDEIAEDEMLDNSDNNQVDFFELIVERDENVEGLQNRTFQFRIEIGYYVQKSGGNTAHTKVRNGLEAVQDLISATLYPDMEILDYFEFVSGAAIAEAIKSQTDCWGGTLTLNGVVDN